MPCDDCQNYPRCINYPDGTWKTVYNEEQEAVARQYNTAKEIDFEEFSKKVTVLSNEIATVNELKKEEDEENKLLTKVENAQARLEKPMDIPIRRRKARQPTPGCTNC